MINFVQNEKRENLKFVAVKQTVVKFTTWSLVVYLLVLFGFLGWWGYLSIKQRRLTAAETALLAQINGLSQNEDLIWKLNSRATFASNFLVGQQDVAKHVGIVTSLGVAISKWDFDMGGKQVLTVGVESSARAEQVVASLLDVYQNVSLVSLDKDVSGDGFAAVISYSGTK